MSGVQRSYLLYVELLAGYLISIECNKKSYIRPPLLYESAGEGGPRGSRRLRNELFCVEWDVKPCSAQLSSVPRASRPSWTVC